MDIIDYLSTKRILVENTMQGYMHTPLGKLSDHIESLNYSLNAGGKRVRPILCIAAGETLNSPTESLLATACALEFIHTYSLIHDDLPSMDDDELRRGKPTNHMIYGEAGAILAGDGLLTLSFEILSCPDNASRISDTDRIKVINLISKAVGSLGMVGGQALDISSENKQISFDTLKMIHSCKTGALITASVQAGAIIGQATNNQYTCLTDYGNQIGLAFQIIDDLLNVEGTTEQLGKTAGSDAEREKATYPAFFGVEETRKRAKNSIESALDSLSIFDHRADPLRSLAQYILTRTN